MNIAAYLSGFLKSHYQVKVPGFGTFSLQNAGASLSEDGKILPPSQQISFEPDFETRDSEFVWYIAEQAGISEFEAELELKKLTNHWKNKLEADQEVDIPGVGKFWNEDSGIQFKGERLESSSPDFYGLEEISLSEIRQSSNAPQPAFQEAETEGEYQFNNSILWIFLVGIPVLGLLFLGLTKQELIFGKKSFDEVSIKTSTKRIKKDSVKVDSAEIKHQDSLKQDSLKTAVVPVKNAAPGKKWNSKKYTKKKKWTSKKRRNR